MAQAFANGEITADEQALYLAYALYKPQSLPVRFQSKVGWRGTQYVKEVQSYFQNLNAAATSAVQQELACVQRLAATVCDNDDGANNLDSTNFRFNYDTISVRLSMMATPTPPPAPSPLRPEPIPFVVTILPPGLSTTSSVRQALAPPSIAPTAARPSPLAMVRL